MEKPAHNSPAFFHDFLSARIGQRVFLNADSRTPNVLQTVKDDYLVLRGVASYETPAHAFIIPLRSIVSLQEVDGIDGLVIYLVR